MEIKRSTTPFGESVIETVRGKKGARMEYRKDGGTLLTMNNGFQRSGASIYSLEVAIMARDVLDEYIRLKATPNELEGE